MNDINKDKIWFYDFNINSNLIIKMKKRELKAIARQKIFVM